MRSLGWIVVAAAAIAATGCDQMRDLREGQGDEGRLGLSLQAPETLEWGGRGTIRVSLENQGGAAVPGATVEVYLPSWLQFASVEPAGTEVTVLSGDATTRLSYRLTDPLEPGERRTVVQHVRVPPAGDGAAAGRDSAALPPPPTNRLMRARLVGEGGEVIGAEVQAVLAFRGSTDMAGAQVSPAPEIIVRTDGIAGVRPGMTVDEIRRLIPDARDTTLGVAAGVQQLGLIVPIGGDLTIIAAGTERGIDRVIVRDPMVRTEEGIGVGSQLLDLRAAYGRGCFEPMDGRAGIWFPAAAGIAFALNVPVPADTARVRADPSSLPDAARVTEVWIRAPRQGC